MNHLFAFPAESNFNGYLYDLNWINKIKNDPLTVLSHLSDNEKKDQQQHKMYILLDAAKYCATKKLDLKKYTADFITISFYKIFGYPTGLGALLVKIIVLKY